MNLLTQNEKQSLKIIIMFLCGHEEGEHPTQLKLLFLDVSRGLQDIAANQYCNFTADFKNIPKRANSTFAIQPRTLLYGTAARRKHSNAR